MDEYQVVQPNANGQSDSTDSTNQPNQNWPANDQASNQGGDNQQSQYDQEIKSEKIETKKKTFFLDLKANDMGRYVKISERSSGKRSTIIVPEENINEFLQKIQSLFQ